MPEPGPKQAATIVALAGGEIIGRTKLQKVACLLELAGAHLGFKFAYHIYGPYSEGLAIAASDADALDLLNVEDRPATWGGKYSIYRTDRPAPKDTPQSLIQIAQTAAKADSIVLELAVTAAFLAKDGRPDAWDEVTSRKKAKATPERIGQAKTLYQSLARDDLPTRLPNI